MQQSPAKKRGRPPKRKMDKPIELSDVVIKPMTAFVVSACPNPLWVTASLGGFRIDVKCPAWASKSLVGKEIEICLVPSETGNYYEYVK
jgi:hypothetical protein